MRLKTFVLGATLLLLITSISNGSVMFAHSSSILNGNILYVGGSGSGNYTKIQDAIDNASDGDTVYVYNGIYTEYDILVDKTLNLVGESKEGVIVDSTGGDICSFKFMQVSNTNISSFTMKNGLLGIWVQYDNIDVEHINITNCIIHDIQYYGIMVIGNQGYVRNSIIKNCEVYNTMNGITLGNLRDSTISECYIHDNDYGIYLIGNVYNNYIYHNNFVNNAEHAKAQETPGECQIWDNGYPSGGNYWDDYTGVDYYRGPNQDIPGSDAIGDTPYILDGDEEDRYPVMPISNLPPCVPSNPNPPEGETHVSVDADLSWIGGDPDPFDAVTYDVYFGIYSPPALVASGQSGTTYDPGTLDYEQTYYWQIVAWDNHGASTEGPIWNFTTEHYYQPQLIIDISGDFGENGWYISDVVITMYVVDGNPYEVYEIMYRINGEPWQAYTEPIIVSEDGEYVIEAYLVDPEGNQGEPVTRGFKIDRTPPTISLTVEKIGDNTWLFTADVSDETSGVNRVEFYLDGKYLGGVTELPYEWEWSGNWYNVEAIVYDNAGNFAIDEHPHQIPIRVFGIIRNPEFTDEDISFFAVIIISNTFRPCILRQLTFQNDYSGYIGKHFISAVFEYGPY